ncbi:4-oxalocrotonate tautomerase [Actinokineospora alba]|uniref:Tautomerase n=1 Tax=Actinokineospora alba TaxID=504798 RepID=A0A1H0V8F0_9PSEU|nr:4-oxalocrotonate tautomerase family protein [Actinokineospora alba]TDP65539.1 4-oxalocrotonate tautomerase [Actinokineospora alba]SDH64878.1 4-oxalocrotonate tautomerase [Actinokineospora alba]SDP74720.1 4-oxalocrotonate tautomerase [Actinokineospora alba]
MPYVNIKITEGATVEEKALLIKGVTELLVEVLDKDPALTHVIIDDVALTDWGVGGRSTAEIRKT